MISQLFREELRRFPVLTSEAGGRSDEFEDLLEDFLVDRFQRVTAALLAQANDDASMGRLLRKSIRHWLIDQARKTGIGALRRSLEKILAEEDGFDRVPAAEPGAGRWRLTGTSALPWSGRAEDLIDAARAVTNIKIPRSSSSLRRSPVADRVSTVAVARAVLKTASGSMSSAQIVEVFVARFPAVLDPAVVPLPDSEIGVGRDEGMTPEETVIAAADELDAAASAAQVVGMLSAAERQIVPYLDDPRGIQGVLGCGRSQAYHHARRLKDKLGQLIGDGEDVRAVGQEVIRLCGGAAEGGS